MGIKIGLKFEKVEHHHGDYYKVWSNLDTEIVGRIELAQGLWFLNLEPNYTVFHLFWLKQIVEFMEKLS